MIRIDAIPTTSAKRKGFGPFTSAITASALFGIYIGMATILVGRF